MGIKKKCSGRRGRAESGELFDDHIEKTRTGGKKIHPKGNIRSAEDGYERENRKCEYEYERKKKTRIKKRGTTKGKKNVHRGKHEKCTTLKLIYKRKKRKLGTRKRWMDKTEEKKKHQGKYEE